MNGIVHVIPGFPQACEIHARKIIERNNSIISGLSETVRPSL